MCIKSRDIRCISSGSYIVLINSCIMYPVKQEARAKTLNMPIVILFEMLLACHNRVAGNGSEERKKVQS